MAKSPEEIVGKFERKRVITGTRPNEGERDDVRYVSFGRGQDPGEEFLKVVRKVRPPLARNGGVVLDRGLPHIARRHPILSASFERRG